MKFLAAAAILATSTAAAPVADPLVYLQPQPQTQQPHFATQVVPTFVKNSQQPFYRQQYQAASTAAEVAQKAAAASKATSESQQYHKQDDFGNYAYGYADKNSAKHEAGTTRSGGVVKGHYVYVDSHGLNRRVDYIADDQGFHAKSSNPNSSSRAKRSSSLDNLMTQRMSTQMVGLSGPVMGGAGYMGLNLDRNTALNYYMDNGVLGQAGYRAQSMRVMPPRFYLTSPYF